MAAKVNELDIAFLGGVIFGVVWVGSTWALLALMKFLHRALSITPERK